MQVIFIFKNDNGSNRCCAHDFDGYCDHLEDLCEEYPGSSYSEFDGGCIVQNSTISSLQEIMIFHCDKVGGDINELLEKLRSTDTDDEI